MKSQMAEFRFQIGSQIGLQMGVNDVLSAGTTIGPYEIVMLN